MLVIGDFGRELVHHCLWKQSLSKVVDRKQTSYGNHPNTTLSLQIVSLLRNTSSWQQNLLTSHPFRHQSPMNGRSRPFFWGPTSLVSAKRRVTLFGPPNRWCTNSKAPTVQIESLRIWSNVTGWYFPNQRGKALKCYLKCITKLPNLWPCCGDITKETSLHKFKKSWKKKTASWYMENKMECIMSCFSWPLPRIPLQKVLAVSLYCRSIFIIFRGQIQLRYLTAYLRFWVKKNLLPISRFVDFSVRQVLTTIYDYYQRCQRIAGITQHLICCWLYILRITRFHTSPNISGT